MATAEESGEAEAGEIGAIAPLLDSLTGIDLTDVVLTADALQPSAAMSRTCTGRGGTAP